MRTIRVNLGDNSYTVQIGAGLLTGVADQLKRSGFKRKAVVVTNPDIKTLYGDTLAANLEAAGFATALLEVPEGEKYKNLAEAGKLYEQLSAFRVERLTPVLALGGGVIGDLTGFVAATYMRGIPLIQLPTTLLAQVDSSVGGKTAVNHGQLKNKVGVFYQPKAVITDIDTLNTLPKIEIENGLAEVIKYGLIRDKELFHIIQNKIERLKSLTPSDIEEVVARCVSIKAEVTEKDEKDLGLRNILNLGHTVGHAVEAVSHYEINHGQAVAIGTVAAAGVAQKTGILSIDDMEAIKAAISGAGLPIKLPRLDIEKILEAMEHDKKKTDGKMRFILPKSIGEVIISDDVRIEMVRLVLREMA
jgi:3-dehydroquinate synthase